MSTPSALASEVRPYRGRVIRIVEGQHLISTNRLAANPADQALLEALADDVKPQQPEAARGVRWLLASPFRYGRGRPSRFRAADVLPGIFYASEDIETAVSEAAHWRLVAFSRSPRFQRPRTPTPMSAFSVMVDAKAALNRTMSDLVRDIRAGPIRRTLLRPSSRLPVLARSALKQFLRRARGDMTGSTSQCLSPRPLPCRKDHTRVGRSWPPTTD